MGPQQQQFSPWYWPGVNPMAPVVPPFGQVQAPSPQQPQAQMPQQTIQQSRPSYIQGRVVETEMDIKPSEIPMDGSVTFFPKSDLTCVYGKMWTQDGILKPLKFVREEDVPAPSKDDPPVQAFDPAVLSDLVEQVVNDKLQSIVQDYLTPITKNQEEILSGLKRSKSNLIVPEEG